MANASDIRSFNEFNEYYEFTRGLIRSKHPEFHIFRLSDVGASVVSEMKPFRTNYFHLSLGSSLSVDLSVFDRKVVSEDYSLVVFLPGQVIEWKRNNDWQGYVIDVKESFLNLPDLSESLRSFEFLFATSPLVIKLSEEDFNVLRYLYELMYAEHETMGQENIFVIKRLLETVLVFVNRMVQKKNGNGKPQIVSSQFSSFTYFDVSSRFRALVIKEYKESKAVGYYAEKLNVTPAYLNKCVRHTHGKTAKHIISEVLLMHSITMLQKPEVRVKEISDELHFEDQSHFIKFFKSMTGKSPSEFRVSMS